MTLKVSNLSKRYGNNWVLKDVSFQVENGEILGLLGSRGSGKTTLLRIIAGAEKPNNGKIFLNSEDVMNITFPESSFYLDSNKNTSFFSRVFGKRRESNPAALENALAGTAKVLLLDESLSDFNSQEKERLKEKVRPTAKEKNTAIIYASDDSETLFMLADRIAILSDGGIIQVGTPQEIYENPNSVAAALVTGRSNIFQARRLTSSKSDLPEFITIDGEHRLFTEKADISKLGAINKNVALAIRPEHISISFGASFPEDNLIRANITDVQFLGPTTLVKLDSNGLKLEALVLRLVGLNVGDECMLGLPPDRIRILKN